MSYAFDATTKRFPSPPSLIVLHWTGGIGGPDQVERTLASRGLSVHYAVSAAGDVVQLASLDRQCAHAGSVNRRSIGIEVCSPGFPGALHDREIARGIERDVYTDHIRGRAAKMVGQTAAQTDAVTALVESICSGLSIPRRVPLEPHGALVRRQLTPGEIVAFRGVLGHYHCHATKQDPGTAPLERLRERWAHGR